MQSELIYYPISKINENNLSPCGCRDLISHWRRYSEKPTIFCSVFGCYIHENLAGGLIKNIEGEIFIIPMCKEHNTKNGEILKIRGNTKLVNPKKFPTCR